VATESVVLHAAAANVNVGTYEVVASAIVVQGGVEVSGAGVSELEEVASELEVEVSELEAESGSQIGHVDKGSESGSVEEVNELVVEGLELVVEGLESVRNVS